MIPYKWPVARAVPQSLQARLEIAKAIRTLADTDDEALRQRRAEIAAIRREWKAIAEEFSQLSRDACALIYSELRKYGYDPEEPRVPAGNPDGGQWTRVAANDDPNPTSDAPRFQPAAKGHHWIPEAVLRKFKFKPETRKVLENASSGALADPAVNHFNRDHRKYNDAVEIDIRKFLAENATTDEAMTPEQAEVLYRRIRGSNDPIIGGLNRKVLRQRLRYIQYFYLRGGGDEE